MTYTIERVDDIDAAWPDLWRLFRGIVEYHEPLTGERLQPGADRTWRSHLAGMHGLILLARFENRAIGVRQAGENGILLLVIEIDENIDGIVGLELGDELAGIFRVQLFEKLLPHAIVEIGKRIGIERRPEGGDDAFPGLGAEELQKVGEIGRMQRSRKSGDEGGILFGERVAHFLDETIVEADVGFRGSACLVPVLLFCRSILAHASSCSFFLVMASTQASALMLTRPRVVIDEVTI